MCWKVGTGTGTSIYINADAWILDAVNFKLSSVVNSMQDVKVNELIDSNKRTWKREFINNTFSADDAGKILHIPLERTLHGDLLRRLFYCGLWAIWGERNRRVHEQRNSTGQQIVDFINNCIAELNGLEIRSSVKGKEIRKWSYPPREFIKINFDGAYDATHHQFFSGIVARNEEGLVLLSCSEIHHGVSFAFVAEAIVCRKAVQVGVEQEWPKVIIEGDSLTIIKKYATKSQDRSHIGAYILDIQQNLNRSRSFIFKHTLRSANALAHIIATKTLKKEEETYLKMRVPVHSEIQRMMDRRGEPD
ncbi:hypothetical protein PVK06_036360 [Gossypium arboreum]|uniref:RNase H type-1 domain-containing protein n=1 Tax=Gossypium arboreum TaxID=29729 RepID=A0ABR0NJD1_GOSAR|nr:hypothetical protein PVK06_036360 [Gossypium arboreum]